MALVANGATLHFDGYEYGVDVDGEMFVCKSFEEMHADYAVNGNPMMFRAVYRTDWWQASDTEKD